MAKARVYLVDDSADIRDVYQRMINRQSDLECVGAAESTVGLEEAVRRAGAEVAVIDLVGPDRDALEAIRATAAAAPGCRIIAFSGHDDRETRERATEAGAWGLVSKNQPPMALIEAIRSAVGEAGGRGAGAAKA